MWQRKGSRCAAKRKSYSEASHQRAFFKWLSLFPKLRALTFHIPNEGRRTLAHGANLKSQGMTKGVWDVFCALPNGEHHGLFLEFKAGKNKLTLAQKEIGERLTAQGYKCIVCYSWFEAQQAIRNYLGNVGEITW